VQSGDVFGVEEYAALAGVVVFEDAVDLAGDVSQLFSNFAVIKPWLLSTGIESRQFRVIVGAKDLHDFGFAEPVTLRPLDRIAIRIVEEDLFGFLGGLGLDDDAGVLAGAAPIANRPASWPAKPMICRPSGRPSADSTGSDRAGMPSIEAGTLKPDCRSSRAQTARHPARRA